MHGQALTHGQSMFRVPLVILLPLCEGFRPIIRHVCAAAVNYLVACRDIEGELLTFLSRPFHINLRAPYED